MPTELEVKFEIGHVLFIDIVGYSKLLISEQSEQLQKLKEIVRGTEQFRRAEAEGKLLRLPTGDGGALVFRTTPEAPVLCALEISKALRSHPELKVRMGIHSGPVNEISDLNEQANIAGAGINFAQRVMDCGDARHILLSKHVSDDLEHYPRWQPFLHELGECEVKHGVRVGVVNLYRDEIGNAQVPKKFRLVRRRRARVRWGVAAAAVLLLVATVLSFFLVLRRPAQSILSLPAWEKSIAVLPLVNTGGDPNNEYFSDGLSEELIAVLAKIPALKIIGRSSSFLFKGTSENSRTIGQKLGVVNLLEGSVRKQGDRVRIVAELISAADGRELWTETYDRELKDVFAVQSEIATAVAAQLKIKLLGPPPQSDAAPLNENLAAYTALQQGNFYRSRDNEEGFRKAIEFYNEAIRLDPTYALAYARLSIAWTALVNVFLGAEGADQYGKARSAAQTALSLPPNLSEAHEAIGFYLMSADYNYDEALSQLRRAEELAPGSVDPKSQLSYLLLTLGRLQEAEEMSRKTHALDPLAASYIDLGRILIAREKYDEAEAVLRKAIERKPKGARYHMQLTTLDLLRGKTAAALEEARLEPAGFWQDYALALAQQAQGDRASADATLQKFIEKHSEGPFQSATIYALRKQPDQMFTWLERAHNARDNGMTQLLTAPFIHNYRGDPRFAALCQKLKLPLPQSADGK
jgi:TolB-like protein/Flp pilus assembly protein TadD/class 3 adenylate cyclase